MAKFLTFKSPSAKEFRETPLKSIWNLFKSLDQFTKGFVIILVLILLATPFIVNNLQIFEPRAQQPGAQESVPDEILVKFKPGVPDQAKEHIRNENVLEKLDEIPKI